MNFFTLASPVNQNFMEALQQLWKQAGINTSIHLYSLAGLIQQFVSKKWQAALQTAGAWDPAAGVGLGFRFLSASPFSGVHDPKLDALILGGQALVDPTGETRSTSRPPSTSPRTPTGRSCSRSLPGTSPCTACRGRG